MVRFSVNRVHSGDRNLRSWQQICFRFNLDVSSTGQIIIDDRHVWSKYQTAVVRLPQTKWNDISTFFRQALSKSSRLRRL